MNRKDHLAALWDEVIAELEGLIQRVCGMLPKDSSGYLFASG
jgi:hypothetical protein